MNFTLRPSLEHMTLVQITIALWNQDDIGTLMAKLDWSAIFERDIKDNWQEIENKVTEKVSKISLPRYLKSKILCFIKPIGLEIFKWNKCQEDQMHSSGINLTNVLCWTPQGTVDRKETAKSLIKHENIDIAVRFRLACAYCLENDIFILWSKLTDNERELFYGKDAPEQFIKLDLLDLWEKAVVIKRSDIIEWRIYNFDNIPPQPQVLFAIFSGNTSAIEYFLKNQTPEERKESLVTFANYLASVSHSACLSSHEKYADVLFFLLSQIRDEQAVEVFKSCAYPLLTGLLDWPRQSFFMGMANRMWDLLPAKEYSFLLHQMVLRRAAGHKDYDYQKLFAEFWKQSPNAHKRYVFRHCTDTDFIRKLLEIEDEKSIKLILNDATLEEKENIFFTYSVMELCVSFMYRGKWDLLKFLIQECTSSHDVMIKFKQEFREHVRRHHSETEGSIWDTYFEFLDNLIHKSDQKRSIDKGDTNPVKRFHHIEFKGSNA